MPSLGFKHAKSYLLNRDNINTYVENNKIGNYALGHMRDNKFKTKYVGRSDNDLNERLKKHIGSKYKRFKFIYQTSPKNAFLKECENYHDFKKEIDNKIHPDKPDNMLWKCPRQCKAI